jgi:hypothetical protein
MSDSPLDLDFKLMPDWLKEPADKNPYADYSGESPDRDGRRGGDRRPQRGGGGGGGRGPRNDGGFRRGPRPGGDRGGDRNRGPRPDGRPDSRGPRGDFKNRGPRRPDERGERSERPSTPRPPEVQIPLNIEFIPETDAVAALAKQIKSGHRAYPLYGLGRMFLNKPERHRVRVTSNAPAYPLFQVGEDGTVTTHRPAAEREAFREAKAQFYTEETTEVEPPKGNYTNVARCRLSGVLLGPTNHHGYQPALRHLYEARFSRRMDFNEFLRQVEVVNDPAVIEEWKKQVSSVTVYRTTQEAEPVEFKTLAEVEAHFKAHYQDKVIKSGRTLEMSGLVSRNVGDRQVRDGIRAAWEKERAFPAQTVNKLRPQFQEAGLHIWKHRKRILFVSTVRPLRFGSESRSVSSHVADLLNVIEASPKCTRADIFNHLLKPHEAEPDFAKLKGALAADLHWLTGSGHVIEFHDGTFDLPLAPKEAAKEEAKQAGTPVAEAQAEAVVETPEAEAAPEAPSETAPETPEAVVETVTVEQPVAVEEPVQEAPVPEAVTASEEPKADAEPKPEEPQV